ncbi:MAG: YicC/YloC family endoribonuclease, partial [bacterium]
DGEAEGVPRADLERARAYAGALRTLADELGLSGEVDLGLVAGFRDVIRPLAAELDPDEAWDTIRPAFQQALDGFLAMRRKEGEALARDVEERLKATEEALGSIRERAPGRIPAYAERLKERIDELLDRVPVDEDRLAQEIAVYADRIDISEECTRLESHLEQARSLMEGDEPSGRSLNFLLQEMHREINTIGSKANDGEINHRVVGMKEELEKIREQVQNIE